VRPSEPPPPAEPPPRAPVVGVVVQRVVRIVSAPSAVAYVDETRTTEPGTEVPMDVDAPTPDLEELDVDLEDGEPAAFPRIPRDSAPELSTEEAEAILEEEMAAAQLVEEEEEERKANEEAQKKKRPSKPPPPPKKKDRSEPAVHEAIAAAKVADGASLGKTPKKARRNWWEELFNDDYLRTVPIPHPKMVLRQCDFIEQRFALAQGATILDVGCGLGLHAVELTRRGYLVVGLDLSLPMLARAADEAQDNGFKINFLHADMREMNFEGAFDAVLCWNTTFGYFDDDTNKLVVERLYRALKPRGLLLLDVANRDFVLRNQPNLVWFEGDGCVVMEESQMNYITSRLDVKRTVILDDGRQRDNLYSLRMYSLHELGQILHHQGFRVVEVTGWEAHPGVFFGGDSPKLIILAERRLQGPPSRPSPSSDSIPAVSGDSASPSEPPPDEHKGASRVPVLAAERPEPSAAVSEALAEALESSQELEQDDPPRTNEIEEELAEEDLEDS
jgi:SAM-dependent methyltransferase